MLHAQINRAQKQPVFLHILLQTQPVTLQNTSSELLLLLKPSLINSTSLNSTFLASELSSSLGEIIAQNAVVLYRGKRVSFEQTCTDIRSGLTVAAQSSMQIILHGWETGKISQGSMQHHRALLLLASKFTHLEFKYFFTALDVVQFRYILHERLHTGMMQKLLLIAGKSMICFSLMKEMKIALSFKSTLI